jgi:hypothetical protein
MDLSSLVTPRVQASPAGASPFDSFDPFRERSPGRLHRHVVVLGGRFEFRSDSPELIALVDAAWQGLPAHRWAGIDTPDFQVVLRLLDGPDLAADREPPEPRMLGGAGLLGAVVDAHNLAMACPSERRGLVAISRPMLRFPYHARYELIEFVAFTLASRAQGLVPLHAGCVGLEGRGALLVGDSGAGKSTLSLHALLEGLAFLTEDATFVQPASGQATGVANFLHLRFDALAFLDDGVPADVRARVAASPVIRRRSGVEKRELDLRAFGASLAPSPLTLAQVVFVSDEPAGAGPLLVPVDAGAALQRLARSQPYASQLPSWPPFAEWASRLPAHVLRRGAHPREGAVALRALLEGHLTAS